MRSSQQNMILLRKRLGFEFFSTWKGVKKVQDIINQELRPWWWPEVIILLMSSLPTLWQPDYGEAIIRVALVMYWSDRDNAWHCWQGYETCEGIFWFIQVVLLGNPPCVTLCQSIWKKDTAPRIVLQIGRTNSRTFVISDERQLGCFKRVTICRCPVFNILIIEKLKLNLVE